MLSPEDIQYYEDLAAKNLDFIFKYFNVDVQKWAETYNGICPIHQYADNPNGFCLYYKQERVRWRCFTHSCHNEYYDTTLGLIRGLLSRESGHSQSFGKAIQFCQEKIKSDGKIKKEYKCVKNSIIIPSYKLHLPREITRSRLDIPSKYFSNRFSSEILDFYDVGESKEYNKKTCFRAIVPVYDEEYKFCIGCLARSVFQKCEKCQCYHNVSWDCPKNYVKKFYAKWKNLTFKSEFSLYNYWFLREKEESVIIVESPGNVWRLREAGILNAVGIYGCRKLNDYQIKMLQKKGTKHLYFALDNDESGKKAFRENGEKLWTKFNIHKLEFPNNDLADMSHKECKSIILFQLKNQ